MAGMGNRGPLAHSSARSERAARAAAPDLILQLWCGSTRRSRSVVPDVRLHLARRSGDGPFAGARWPYARCERQRDSVIPPPHLIRDFPLPHDTPLIATVAAAFVLALVFGFLATRLRLPPLVGYLLAGIALGPFTPGLVADANLAAQLADVGVILLMFGVGLHFSSATCSRCGT